MAWLWLTLSVTAGVALDQATKAWAASRLPGRPFVELVPGLLELRYSLNAGVAFGLGQALPVSYRAGLLLTLSALGIAVLLRMFARAASQPSLRVAIALLLTGGLGNVVDRALRGEVIDFIHLRFGDRFQLGTFNGADALIVIGLVPLIASLFRPQTAQSGSD